MAFHPAKCTTVHMTRRRTTLPYEYQLHGQKLQEVTQAKYLGVTLTKDLKWNTHIANITTKANRALGFARRNIKLSNKKVKAAAYKALVRPILEYASPVWDPHTAEDSASLEKVQRRAARWVSHRFRQTSSVNNMLEDLVWPTLESRRRRARLTTFYKVHHDLVAVKSNHAPKPSPPKCTTRQIHALSYEIPHSRTAYRQKTFFPRTIPEWNRLPVETATAPSLASFQAGNSPLTHHPPPTPNLPPP
ncbi:hypothetical protein V1264_006033 [Littorina saxatilis]|uniref:Uncharacterized protein n=1 Tax=Littorina saxatilis TaxID=31220 RepID=A0AAN9AWY4_9CAEN